jgi:2-polyprenyl-3-methyl-5-hydroxy-6-metoxy-1,4-benzoquinol methylase
MERLNDKEFLQVELDSGVSFDNPNFLNLALRTAEQLQGLGKSVLDFGAGVGVYSHAFIEKGFNTFSFEVFPAHREYIKMVAPHINLIDFPITTDILVFIETAEHMTDQELDNLFIRIQPKYILFSSTSEKTPFDYAWGHINVKEQYEWDEFFIRFGYRVMMPLQYPTNWSKLYIKLI